MKKIVQRQKSENILYINGLPKIGEEICALPVKKIVQERAVSFPFNDLAKISPRTESLPVKKIVHWFYALSVKIFALQFFTRSTTLCQESSQGEGVQC